MKMRFLEIARHRSGEHRPSARRSHRKIPAQKESIASIPGEMPLARDECAKARAQLIKEKFFCETRMCLLHTRCRSSGWIRPSGRSEQSQQDSSG